MTPDELLADALCAVEVFRRTVYDTVLKAIAEEREACAQIAEGCEPTATGELWWDAARVIAAEIRNRK